MGENACASLDVMFELANLGMGDSTAGGGGGVKVGYFTKVS